MLKNVGEYHLEISVRKKSIILSQAGEEIPHTVESRKANCIGHILCRNCLLKHVNEGKIEVRILVMGRRNRKCKQLLD
jgi:hypothetical protein